MKVSRELTAVLWYDNVCHYYIVIDIPHYNKYSGL